MDVEVILLIRALTELMVGVPELVKLLERIAAGEKLTKEFIEAKIGETKKARTKWEDSIAKRAAGAAAAALNSGGENP